MAAASAAAASVVEGRHAKDPIAVPGTAPVLGSEMGGWTDARPRLDQARPGHSRPGLGNSIVELLRSVGWLAGWLLGCLGTLCAVPAEEI